MTRPGVHADQEFRRIRDLPRRPQEWTDAELEEACDLLTAHFRTLSGAMRLKPIQARALVEAMDYGKVVGEVGAGHGKAQPLTATVMCPDGPRKMSDLRVGDDVLCPDGTVAKILGVFAQGTKGVFRVRMSDGSSTRCCDDHLWLTRTDHERSHKEPGAVRSTRELRATLVTDRGRTNHDVPVSAPAPFSEKSYKIPPYVLGVLIGDGTMRTSSISFYTADQQIVNQVTNALVDTPYQMRAVSKNRHGFAGASYRIGNKQLRRNTIQEEIKRLGLYGHYSHEKFLPTEYLCGSIEQRVSLLRGLMDTDGHCSKEGGTCVYYTSSERLAADIQQLVWSLGGTTTISNKQTFFTHKNECRSGRPSFVVSLALPNEINPFSVERKASRVVARTKYFPTRYVLSIEPDGEEECQCLLIDHPDHLYLTDDFIVTHNTLLSFLLFTAWSAERGLLLVPAHLREKTQDDYAVLQKHWRLLPLFNVDPSAVTRPHFRVLSYQSLSSVRFAAFLDEFRPDVVVADESHYLARTRSARGKRFFRHFRQTEPPPRFAPLSGTPRRKSIRECAHIYEAALGDGSPLPCDYVPLEQWCYALDEGVQEHARLDPGALATFAGKVDPSLDEVRRGIRDRLLATPGVVATRESEIGVSLVLQVRPIDVPGNVREAMAGVRAGHLPTGETFDSGITTWNHAREAATGFVYRWDPPAPEEWSDAKRAWQAFVEVAMDNPPPGAGHLDSPLQVWNAVKNGRFGDPEAVEEWVNWRDIRGTFEPNPVPFWISDYLVKDAEEWALKTGGIVWISHTSAFTKADSAGLGGEGDVEADVGKLFSRIPYFGAGQEAIKTHRGPCVASVRAWGTGQNFQQWSRALWLTFPSSGSTVEQLAARHHRLGQEADEVHIEFYCHSREMFEAVQTAQRDATFMRDLNGNSQRILTANILDEHGHRFDPGRYEAMINAGDDPMWAR